MLDALKTAEKIKNGETFIGIEFGSTRIKAVLTDEKCTPLASGSFTWENELVDGIWTYSLDSIIKGLQVCFSSLKSNVREEYNMPLVTAGAIGISAMMHGYMAFDKNDELLVPFRTWRNTITAKASEKLSGEFGFNIPERWSIAHLYQEILNDEYYVKQIRHLNTLAGYIHFILTGERVLGIGDASGMFPVDSEKLCYNEVMLDKFEEIIHYHYYKWKIRDILPKILLAGDEAGVLTKEGALVLDPTGEFMPGVRFCPPEGDAGTGMVATNSVRPLTGNVSAGTSVFAMAVLDKAMKGWYPEIDVVATPAGKDVAMVHCNNCCSDIDAWAEIFSQFSAASGNKLPMSKVYDVLYDEAAKGNKNCGGVTAFNYVSGESITKLNNGAPMIVRRNNSEFSLADFFRANLYSALATLRIGMNILYTSENLSLSKLAVHGGFVKSSVGQSVMADAMNTPVTVYSTAGEGGPWGMAILASYTRHKNEMSLEDYLDNCIFSSAKSEITNPDKDGVTGFNEYLESYEKLLEAERKATEILYKKVKK
ncbi:MAG: ATPase [Clostridiales bacterium]|nr:ATPase [Clostridiales bacterium]